MTDRKLKYLLWILYRCAKEFNYPIGKRHIEYWIDAYWNANYGAKILAR